MRPDMKNLLVEGGHAFKEWPTKRPKGWMRGCRFRNAEDRNEECYLAPKFRPQFSENLPPLRRYLERQVGRPWDKVYSEIRAHVNANSAVQYHILQHLYDRLVIHVQEDNKGRLWAIGWSGRPVRLDVPWRHPILYVCPRSGLLKRTPRLQDKLPKADMDVVSGSSADHEYRRLGEQWYEVWWGSIFQDGTWVRAIVQKRQLGYKELRKLGLRD